MNVFWRINELNQANGKAQALLMAHIHLSQALGKGLGSLFFFDHESNSKFAASKKKDRIFLLSKVRFPTFVVRRRNRPAGEGNSEFNSYEL